MSDVNDCCTCESVHVNRGKERAESPPLSVYKLSTLSFPSLGHINKNQLT